MRFSSFCALRDSRSLLFLLIFSSIFPSVYYCFKYKFNINWFKLKHLNHFFVLYLYMSGIENFVTVIIFHNLQDKLTKCQKPFGKVYIFLKSTRRDKINSLYNVKWGIDELSSSCWVQQYIGWRAELWECLKDVTLLPKKLSGPQFDLLPQLGW